jgi:predicted  nucleic acid-binding Zn-ribbon protein
VCYNADTFTRFHPDQEAQMRPVALLAQLNEADLALDAVKVRLSEIAEALKEPAALQATRRALAEAEAELARCRAQQLDAELAEKKIAQKLTSAEHALYSGQIRNPKALEDAEKDVQQLRRQRSQAEDALLEAMMCAEAALQTHAEQERKLTRLTAEWEATQVALRAEQAALNGKLPMLKARHTAARGAVPANLLPTYDSLRTRRGGRAVAQLDGDTCTACRVAASPGKVAAARDGDELIFCENCGRVLWAE